MRIILNNKVVHTRDGMRTENNSLMIAFFCVAVLVSAHSALAGENMWTTNGPHGSSINAVAISPAYASDHTLYAGSARSGVFRSADGGKTWRPVNDGLFDYRVQSLAISPNYASDSTLFAGTWSGVIYRTVNGGKIWKQTIKGLNTGMESNHHAICAIAFSPAYKSDHTAFAGTWGGGIYKTTDGGDNWIPIDSGLGKTPAGDYPVVYSLAVSPGYAADKTVYGGTFGRGLIKSGDGGKSWSEANKGITSSQAQVVSISPDYVRDRTVYAGTFGGGVYKTSDGGANWIPVNRGLKVLAISALAVSPDYARDKTVYAVSWADGIYRSRDGGKSWSGLNEGIITTGDAGRTNLYIYCIVPAPDFSKDKTLFTGTYWSVYSFTEK